MTAANDYFQDAGGFLSSYAMSKFAVEASSPTLAADLKAHFMTYNATVVKGYQLDATVGVLSVVHNPLLASAVALAEAAGP